MAEPSIDPWFAGFIGTLASASLVMWFVLARRRPLLSYEPRSPVPWNFVGPLFVLTWVLLGIGMVVWGPEVPQRAESASPSQMSKLILEGAVTQIILFGSMFIAVAVFSRATQRDCGLPEFADQFGRDLKLGAVTWLAVLLPVYGLQVLLATVVGEESSHPLIQMLDKEMSVPLMFVAFLAAVVVAPICEEIAFRLLLQGWLEKIEDQRLGWRAVEVSAVASDIAPEPPRRGLAGLPYGWVPIFGSSLVFAAAHVGYGPDPVALFLLAIMLGFVYQRTHRIIPCIVTHMLFNLTTLTILAIAVARGAR